MQNRNSLGQYTTQFPLTKAELEQMYTTERLSSIKIATKIGINGRTVRRWLRYYNIPRRTQSEWVGGIYHPMYKMNHSSEAKEKISEAKKGKSSNSPTKIKKGQHLSPKTEFKRGSHPSTQFEPNDPRLIGENNPRWKGGYEPYYGPDWRGQRRRALKRDDHTCQFCGTTENEREHDVHHKISYRICKNNKLDNLVTLCRSCHTKVENAIILEEHPN